MQQPINKHRWYPPSTQPARPHGVYLLHGTGEHAARYERLASSLASKGWIVGAHDHPGHGQSDGKRGLIDPAGSLSTQAVIQIQAFANETGSAPIVFGHSLGGVLATQLVLAHQLPVSGLILSAPAYVVRMGPVDRLKLKLLTLIAPRLCLDLGYSPVRLTHDEEQRRIALADPLIHGYKSSTLVNWLLYSGRRCLDLADKLQVNTLLLIAGEDLVVDSDKTRFFASKVADQYLTVHEYPDGYHELLNELPEIRDKVLADIEQWLDQ